MPVSEGFAASLPLLLVFVLFLSVCLSPRRKRNSCSGHTYIIPPPLYFVCVSGNAFLNARRRGMLRCRPIPRCFQRAFNGLRNSGGDNNNPRLSKFPRRNVGRRKRGSGGKTEQRNRPRTEQQHDGSVGAKDKRYKGQAKGSTRNQTVNTAASGWYRSAFKPVVTLSIAVTRESSIYRRPATAFEDEGSAGLNK